jgi:hypothetical protein
MENFKFIFIFQKQATMLRTQPENEWIDISFKRQRQAFDFQKFKCDMIR